MTSNGFNRKYSILMLVVVVSVFFVLSTVRAQDAELTGTIQIYAAGYTPSENMEQGPTNPNPIQMLQVLVDEYTALHPGVTIEIIRRPANVAEHEWIVTQQIGGTIPHIVQSQAIWIKDELDKSWWVPLTPYFDEPNPYVAEGEPGSEHWLNQFYEIPTETKVLQDGNHYVVPLDLVTTFFFYNKDIFDAVGIEAPTTYGEFVEVQQKLLDAGYIPNARILWYHYQLGSMLYADKEPIINPDGGIATLEEVSCATVNGQYRATDPEFQEWMRMMQELAQFLTPDWAAEGVDLGRKFINQELAILEDGTWRFGLLRADPLLEFEWGTFYAPVVTPEDSPFGIGVTAHAIGGATAGQWAVSTRAEREGVLPAVIDFLRYVSAPENAGRMINERGEFLANIKGIETNPDLVEPLRAITEGVGQAGMVVHPDKIRTEQYDKWLSAWTSFLLGDLSWDDATQEFDALLLESSESLIAEGNWDCGS